MDKILYLKLIFLCGFIGIILGQYLKYSNMSRYKKYSSVIFLMPIIFVPLALKGVISTFKEKGFSKGIKSIVVLPKFYVIVTAIVISSIRAIDKKAYKTVKKSKNNKTVKLSLSKILPQLDWDDVEREAFSL